MYWNALRIETESQTRMSGIIMRLNDLKMGEFRAFLEERLASTDYSKRLGIVGTIRQDFEYRSQELKQRAEADLPERVILYIDDLDRCPTRRVVQVLEAIHILLAFDLFVVVVGVDSRWLLAALSRHYSDLVAEEPGPYSTRTSDPARLATAQNYLEKIFQIPYQVPRMDPNAFGSLIDSLFHDTPGANGALQPMGQAELEPVEPARSGEVTRAGSGNGVVARGATTVLRERPRAARRPRQPKARCPDRRPCQPSPIPKVADRERRAAVHEDAGASHTHTRAAKRLVNTYRLAPAGLHGGRDTPIRSLSSFWV